MAIVWIEGQIRHEVDKYFFCLYNTSFITSVNTETENVFFLCIKLPEQIWSWVMSRILINSKNCSSLIKRLGCFLKINILEQRNKMHLPMRHWTVVFHIKYCMSHDLKCKRNPFLLTFYILFCSALIVLSIQPAPPSIHITFWACTCNILFYPSIFVSKFTQTFHVHFCIKHSKTSLTLKRSQLIHAYIVGYWGACSARGSNTRLC